MAASTEVKLRVPFHDLDPIHVVWHGNYFKYFDIARFRLFEEAGIDLYQYSLTEKVIFPITRSAIKHIVPLRHHEEFLCRARVTEADFRIAMEFEIRRLPDDLLCTRGNSQQVAVKLPDMEMELEIPREITAALGFR